MMSCISFGISMPNAPAISEQIVASTLHAIQHLLPEYKVRQLCEEAGYVWRKRVLSPAVTVLHMILAALWSEESFNASWQVQWNAVVSRRAAQSQSRGHSQRGRGPLHRVEHRSFGHPGSRERSDGNTNTIPLSRKPCRMEVPICRLRNRHS